MIPDLIFDVGMHNGSDTEFYLAKGFRVVAIEANPVFCEQAQARFRREIAQGRLVIVNEGVADVRKELTFYVNDEKDDWSSFDPEFARRSENIRPISVYCRRLSDLFDQFGVPYYLKIDIEGFDEHCIADVERAEELPRFVSTEATVSNFGQRMAAKGYGSFKIISQYWIQSLACPRPPREGLYVDQAFTGFSSGPFGEETYGSWLDLAAFEAEYKACAERIYAGSLHEKLGCPEEIFQESWFDFHARLG
jgi:FkbM family methyltransferase